MTKKIQNHAKKAVLVTALVLLGIATVSVAAGAGVIGTSGDTPVGSADVVVQSDNGSVTAETVVGDANQDGAVTSADAQLILQASAGQNPSGFFPAAADMNRDGDVRANDAQRALLKSAGALDEAEVAVSNLSAPGTATSGDTITVSADLENLGNEGALRNISFRIAPEGETLDENDTLDEKFVDMAVSGVSNPVDRPAETTIEFTSLTVDLPEGNYTHGIFSGDDSATGTINVEPGDGAITGNVSLDTSSPDEDVNVTVTADDDNGTTYSETVEIAGDNDTATYTLDGVEENVGSGYTVTATAANYTDASAQNVIVNAGETVTQDLTLDRLTGSLDGTVTNDTASPIEGATVNVSAFGQSGPVVASATTDANGSYTITDLPVGDHYVTVSVDGAVAGTATVSIADNATTTEDFNLTEASFDVSLQSAPDTTANSSQAFSVEVTNTGDLTGTQTVSLDWGGNTYSNSTAVTVAGGESSTQTLQVDIDSTQAVGLYDVNVSSDDDFDTAEVAVGPQRSLNTTSPAPGQTVEVTVTGEIASQNDITLVTEWSPSANDSRIVSTSFSTDINTSDGTSAIVGMPDAGPGTLTVVYEIDISSNANDGDVYEWDPLMGGDGSLLRVGNEDLPILGDQEFQVST